MNSLGQIRTIRRPGDLNIQGPNTAKRSGVSFAEVLQGKLEDTSSVKFSAHAVKRLSMRNIRLSDEQLAKLNTAVNKAQDKGSKDSLIMMNDMAFVVSVENKTVITAMNGDTVKENVFTNIDSAVMI